MGCCGNKTECQQKQHTNATNVPRHEIVDALSGVSVSLVTTLYELASSGLDASKILRGLDIKNTALEQLAKQIADLAVENAYFKSVLNLFTPCDVNVADSEIEIHFGPKNTYTLKMPVTSHNSRKEIAKQFRAAANKLEAELKTAKPVYNPFQQLFPFFGSATETEA
jgi:hypothetical protein